MFPEISRLLWLFAAPHTRLQPASHPGASCHLSPESVTQRESLLSIWDVMRPSFVVYSSWQANPCVMHGRGWERFLSRGTGRREAASPRGTCRAPLAWLSLLRIADPHTSRFLVWNHRTDSVCVILHLLGELLHVSWAVVVSQCSWCEAGFTQLCWEFIPKVRNCYAQAWSLLFRFAKECKHCPHTKRVWMCLVSLALLRVYKAMFLQSFLFWLQKFPVQTVFKLDVKEKTSWLKTIIY